MPSPLYRLLALVVCVLLAACATESAPPAPAVPPAPQTLSARDAAARQIHVDPSEAARLISQYRAAHGLGAVSPDPVLQKLAQAQADAMAAHDILSHTIAGTLNARFDSVDLGDAAGVENVSAGYFSLPAALAGWRKSPPHNANLLAPKMRRLGLAMAYAPGTRYLTFWALDMSN
jgi:uncharacterized protein YkwD